MENVIEKAKKELAQVEARAEELRTFIRTYDSLYHGMEHHGESRPILLPRKGGIKAKIITIASSLLSNGAHLSTREILGEIEKRGIRMGSKDQVLALSSILSRHGSFKADRSLGWSLK